MSYLTRIIIPTKGLLENYTYITFTLLYSDVEYKDMMLASPTTEDISSETPTTVKNRIPAAKPYTSSPPSKYYRLDDEYSDSSGGSGYYNDYTAHSVS